MQAEPASPIDLKWVRDQATFEREAKRASWKMARLKLAGRLVPPGSKVLDFGCGSMFLSRYLPEGCIYVPADLYADRDPRIIPVDMNAGEFPDGHYDVVAMLAVLFAADDPAAVLKRAREHASLLLVTSGPELGEVSATAFGRPLSFAALDASGWSIARSFSIPLPLRRRFDPHHKLLICTAS